MGRHGLETTFTPATERPPLQLPRVHRQDAVALDLDFPLTPEQIEQNRDSLPRRDDSRDQHPQATERASCDDDFRSGLRIGGDFHRLVITNKRSQIGHDRVVDGSDLLAEMHNACHPGEGINLSATLEVFEAGKEVAGEKRFRRPKWLSAPHPTKANARGKDFETQLTLQDKRDFVFLLWRGVETIPVQ
jgi:hypothetical protein